MDNEIICFVAKMDIFFDDNEDSLDYRLKKLVI
jgi:hypothetical protein